MQQCLYVRFGNTKIDIIIMESVLLEECCGITHKYEDSVCVSRGVSRLNDAQKFVFFYGNLGDDYVYKY